VARAAEAGTVVVAGLEQHHDLVPPLCITALPPARLRGIGDDTSLHAISRPGPTRVRSWSGATDAVSVDDRPTFEERPSTSTLSGGTDGALPGIDPAPASAKATAR
jgi:hypothetical protein